MGLKAPGAKVFRDGTRDMHDKNRAHSAGFLRTQSRKSAGTMVWRLACSRFPECTAAREFPGNGYGDPDPMVKQIRGEGWFVDYGKPALCPDHAPKKHKETKMDVAGPQPGAILEGDPPPIVRPPPVDEGTRAGPASSQPDMKLTRAVMNLLDEVFDEEKKLYRPQWNDRRVAKETGASDVYVVHVRRQAFGELAMDPAMSNIQVEFLKLGTDMQDAMVKYAELQKRYHHLATKLEQYVVARII